MGQQLALQPSQFGPGLEAGRLPQCPSGPLDGPQRIGLPAGAVERQREQALQALVEGVPVDGPLERNQCAGVIAQSESSLGRGAGRHGREAVEVDCRVDHEGLVGQLGEQRSATQLVGLLEIGQARVGRPGPEVVAPGLDQILVAQEVEIGPVDRQAVPRGLGDEHRGGVAGPAIGLDDVAQARDVGLQRPEATRVAVPQELDQAIGRHDLVGLEQEQSQHGALLRRPGLDLDVALTQADAPEDLEVHRDGYPFDGATSGPA